MAPKLVEQIKIIDFNKRVKDKNIDFRNDFRTMLVVIISALNSRLAEAHRRQSDKQIGKYH